MTSITITQGETFTFYAVWKIDAEPVDLTGYAAAAQARHTPDSHAALIDLDASDIELSADGEIEFTLSAAQTAQLPAGSHVLGLEVTAPDESVRSLITSIPLRVVREVVR